MADEIHEQPMSAASYKARADATRRENEEADRREAEEEEEARRLTEAKLEGKQGSDFPKMSGAHSAANTSKIANATTQSSELVTPDPHAIERVPAGAEMAKCSTCRQEFPRDYIANGVCATCRPQASWTGETR